MPPGEAAARVAALRNKRVDMSERGRGDSLQSAKLERARARQEAGGIVLPPRYRHTRIKQQSGVKFEEFDFSYYNRTRLAGLENDLPNCYCNPLLQALYYAPVFRQHVLRHAPEPASEFCLTCELGFLFRMLMTPNGGTPCRAQVRQNSMYSSCDGAVVAVACLGGGGALCVSGVHNRFALRTLCLLPLLPSDLPVLCSLSVCLTIRGDLGMRAHAHTHVNTRTYTHTHTYLDGRRTCCALFARRARPLLWACWRRTCLLSRPRCLARWTLPRHVTTTCPHACPRSPASCWSTWPRRRR